MVGMILPGRFLQDRSIGRGETVTTAELTKRLMTLERTVEKLKAQMVRPSGSDRRWWMEDAGRFANDPVFEEIVRLGQQYRESLRPAARKATGAILSKRYEQ